MGAFDSVKSKGSKYVVQKFLASGTFTPTAELLLQGGKVKVTICGGGGGGGGLTHDGSNTYGASGGGGGGASTTADLLVTSPQAITIGAGGTGVYASSGNSGGSTYFGNILMAFGGNYGNQNSIGGLGGSLAGIRYGYNGNGAYTNSNNFANAGTFNPNNGTNENYLNLITFKGASGGNGVNQGGASCRGGFGGASIGGAGGIPGSSASGTNGGNGGLGAGGAGATSSGNSYLKGGDGGNGFVIVEWWE